MMIIFTARGIDENDANELIYSAVDEEYVSEEEAKELCIEDVVFFSEEEVEKYLESKKDCVYPEGFEVTKKEIILQ